MTSKRTTDQGRQYRDIQQLRESVNEYINVLSELGARNIIRNWEVDPSAHYLPDDVTWEEMDHNIIPSSLTTGKPGTTAAGESSPKAGAEVVPADEHLRLRSRHNMLLTLIGEETIIDKLKDLFPAELSPCRYRILS